MVLAPWLLLGAVGAQESATDAPTPAQVLAEVLADPALSDARFGVHVVDLESGEELLNHDTDKGFMTASNMKLMSSAVALHGLGPDNRFVTRLGAVERIGESQSGSGRHLSSLFLIGDGDPTLGGRHEDAPMACMADLAAAIKEVGITTVGTIYPDTSCHADEVMGQGWQWDYQDAAYAAQISGLCFNENIVRLALRQGEDGKLESSLLPASVGTNFSPDGSFVSIHSLDVTCLPDGSDAKSDIRSGRVRGTNRIWATGRLAPDDEQVLRYSVEWPELFATEALSSALLDVGIRVYGRAGDPGRSRVGNLMNKDLRE